MMRYLILVVFYWSVHMKLTTKNALILAAGKGSRLADSTIPKPLRPLLGIPLLARTILTLKQAGITDFYIVIGFEGQKIRTEIDFFFRSSLNLNWIENKNWELPNGHSVMCASNVIDDNFVLTMSDHLFTKDMVFKLFQNYEQNGGDLHLAVDYSPSSYHDIDDATKVNVKDGKIVDIGKKILSYNAYDTGIFLVTPKLFRVLQNINKERIELSDGVRELSSRGSAYAVNIENNLWFDIDLPIEFKIASKLLLKSLIKPTDGIISINFNRHISLFITKLLTPTKVTPNMITIITFIIALIGAILPIWGGYSNFLISGLIFQLTSILDGCDGEIARLKFQSSKTGEWMDTIFDNLSYILSLLGLTIACYLSPNIPDFYHQVGFSAFVLGLIIFPIFYIYLKRNKRKASMLDVDYGTKSMNPINQKIFALLYMLGKRDLFALIFMFFAIFGVFEYAIIYSSALLLGLIFMAIRAYFIAATSKGKNSQSHSH